MTCSPKSMRTEGPQRARGSSLIEANRLPGITTKNNQNLLFDVLEHDVCVCVCTRTRVLVYVCFCVSLFVCLC